MKRITLLLLSFIITCSIFSQGFKENAKIYDISPYNYEKSDPHRPIVMGVSSLIIPGLGQFIMKENERGLAFVGGYFASAALFLPAILLIWADIVSESQNHSQTINIFVISSVTAMGIIHLWSGFDAFRVARINNLAFRDSRVNFDMKLSPYFNTGGVFPEINTHRGLIFSIKF